MAFELKSSAFETNERIPKKYTCEGLDVSVPLIWSEVPEGTKALALIADDPDAPGGTWVHWVVYDLPARVTHLTEAVPGKEDVEGGGRQGINDFKRVGYGGPCPPPGPTHRYFFKLYALDHATGLAARATKRQVVEAIQGHILAEAQLVGTYSR
ncbi:MAG: YbhB/YbcL family Raf kinase inhibitor-like protein [Acidobacteria bacterium]|nr:MAG: YbhB/YbcL family Raf kinase inhibitor-like protein [Acidobacteriota bacterium]RPJ63528.1 MAG: YbhB/YbcL family Raf kinase inhibitor-like protein [Acidobacteriota bacterium]